MKLHEVFPYASLFLTQNNSVGDLFWDGENVTLSKVVGDLQIGDEKITA